MIRQLNTYRSNERDLAANACHRLNTEPYTLMRNESRRPTYELQYDHALNLFVILATYYPLDNSQFARKQIRNRRKTTLLNALC